MRKTLKTDVCEYIPEATIFALFPHLDWNHLARTRTSPASNRVNRKDDRDDDESGGNHTGDLQSAYEPAPEREDWLRFASECRITDARSSGGRSAERNSRRSRSSQCPPRPDRFAACSEVLLVLFSITEDGLICPTMERYAGCRGHSKAPRLTAASAPGTLNVSDLQRGK
jgi:hypothetical protein